jgi:hypothetical protein
MVAIYEQAFVKSPAGRTRDRSNHLSGVALIRVRHIIQCGSASFRGSALRSGHGNMEVRSLIPLAPDSGRLATADDHDAAAAGTPNPVSGRLLSCSRHSWPLLSIATIAWTMCRATATNARPVCSLRPPLIRSKSAFKVGE